MSQEDVRSDDYLILAVGLTQPPRSGRLAFPPVAGFADKP
jgi:hypothetical protein